MILTKVHEGAAMKITPFLFACTSFGFFFTTNANASVLLGSVPVKASVSFTSGLPQNSGGGLALLFNAQLADFSDCIGCSPYLAPGSYSDVTCDFTAA